jgi:hypothetical protein
MDKYMYSCHYCGKDYIPKRRHVQKYCSNSCRTNAYLKRRNVESTSLPTVSKNEVATPKPCKIDKMSFAGVGNAATGSALIRIAESLLTPEINKPATKGDLKNLEEKISKRYYLVQNMQKNPFGKSPYFDTITGVIVYF